MNARHPLANSLACVAILSIACNSRNDPARPEIRVFMADSLFQPFKAAKPGFEAANPDCQVQLIPSGSVLAARKIVDAQDRCDVLAVADYLVIEKMLMPQHAVWYACFATNEVVIAYTEASRGAAELKVDNWFEVLSREGVKVGSANPYQDPCGYWAELCWKLADLHYKDIPAASIHERMSRQCGPPADRRSDTEELLQILESAAGIDYAFVYLSQARQHRLPALRLPPQINLGNVQYADFYRKAQITLPGTADKSSITKQGEAICYAITVPKTAAHPALGVKYIEHLLSPAGRKALAEQHMVVAEEPWTYDMSAIPEALKDDLAARPRLTTQPSTTHADAGRS